LIEIRGLRVAYGRTLALRDIDLTLPPGVTGVFGQNGAGKSTLLRVLAGLLAPTAGTVLLDDTPLSIADEDARRRISYMGHSTGLYRQLTLRENLELFAHLSGVPGARIDAVLNELSLIDKADTRITQLSAGMKRRSSLARAVLHEPDILLLDEPYANLDDDASDRVSDVISRWSNGPRYALVATHGAKRVKAYADGGIILKQGTVVSHQVRTSELGTRA
jgi:heme exporter protein A